MASIADLQEQLSALAAARGTPPELEKQFIRDRLSAGAVTADTKPEVLDRLLLKARNETFLVKLVSEIRKDPDAPVLEASFRAQEWIGDNAVTVEQDEETDFKVPLADAIEIFAPHLLDQIDLEENFQLPSTDYATDDLRSHAAAPEWMGEWTGPFEVDIENEFDLGDYLDTIIADMRHEAPGLDM